MIKRPFLLVTLVFLLQCSDKEVMLPVVAEGGIAETQNHSSIWIFYDASGSESKAVLNKNNKLINTNWIFNIDRRLTMKDVIPLLQAMQADRNKDSMHKKEGMVNFFSYADSKNERISLVSFPDTDFVETTENSGFDPIDKDTTLCHVPLRIFEDELRLGRVSGPVDQIAEMSAAFKDCEDGKTQVITLVYDEELSFQAYLETKVFLAAAGLTVDTTERVETLK